MTGVEKEIAKSVLVVGNCLPDNFTIGRWLKKNFGVEFYKAKNRTSALKLAGERTFDLILINRVFDADGGDGLELVSELGKIESSIPLMLISNFPDAQSEAVKRGAVTGFGKAELRNPQTREKVQQILG